MKKYFKDGSIPRTAWAWASYDFANSVFATTVMAGFFPVFLNRYWRGAMSHGEVFALLAWVNAGVAAATAILAPILGAIADYGKNRKTFLSFFFFSGVCGTALLSWPSAGQTLAALIFFGLASLGYVSGNVFYNALLPHVVDKRHLDRVSALGYSVGYLGGGLLFAVNVAMVASPHWFGFDGKTEAVKAAFISAAIWWGTFGLIILFYVKERRGTNGATLVVSLTTGVRHLVDTVAHLRYTPIVGGFLVVYWLYIDGVNSVFKLAVGYGLAVGLPSTSLLLALLVTQFVAFPSAIALGWLGEKFGARVGITVGLMVYIFVVGYAVFLHHAWQFYMLAVLIGLVQGGTQSLSRSLFARLVPSEKSATYFGLYGLTGKFSAVLGPLLVAGLQTMTGNSRLAILSIVVIFILGLFGLWRLPLSRQQLS